ncbi:MAG: oligosaccharide flippase family protein [Saprospiraceae bacterium]|nr:oligosaccharide flippase family protein [Saprospiraceae bacterium]
MSFGRLVKSVFFLISVSVFKDLGWKGLILSVLIGQICQLMLNVDVLIKKASKKVPTYIEITSIARKYFASPKYNIPLSLLIATSDYIFYALIRQFWGLYFLGNFSMAEKIVRIPVSLIGQPLSEKFFKTSSNQNSSGEIDKLRVRFLSYLKDGFLLLIIPSIICAVFGEKIVKILLPEQWHNVGWIIRIMSPLIFTYFLIASMRILPIVLNIQRRYTFLESLTFLLLCFLITAAGVLGFPDYLLVILKMAGEVLISLYITYWLYNKIGIQSNSNA